MHDFVSGTVAMGYAAIALFFLRFWIKTSDRLFATLGWAFALLCMERVVLVFVSPALEGRHWIYVARLIAFGLIILGIWDKNRSHRERETQL